MYKLDDNHKDIVDAFRQLGAMVVEEAKAERYEAGILDLWVGLFNPFHPLGLWIWVEVKTCEGELSPSQAGYIKRARNYGLPCEVVRSTKEVEEVYCRYLAIMHDGTGEPCPGCGRLQPANGTCGYCIPF
jgi:hypothetical protein